MTADDLSAPLGQQQAKRRRRFPIAVPHVIAAALALFFGVFVIWAIVGDNPFGGEPMVAVPIGPDAAAASKKAEMTAPPGAADATQGPGRYDGPTPGAAPGSPAPGQSGAGNTKTVTIIDGKTGARQEVVIPDSGNGAAPAESSAVNQKFVEMTPRGPIPKIAVDGVRPAEAFARPVKPIPGKPDAPRIAVIVSGLGVSTSLAQRRPHQVAGGGDAGFHALRRRRRAPGHARPRRRS